MDPNNPLTSLNNIYFNINSELDKRGQAPAVKKGAEQGRHYASTAQGLRKSHFYLKTMFHLLWLYKELEL